MDKSARWIPLVIFGYDPFEAVLSMELYSSDWCILIL